MNCIRVLIALIICSFSAFAQISRLAINAGWDPVTESERSLAKPVVDPQAGAEALFWRVHVVDELAGGSDPQRHVFHYIRLKIFNDAGKESASTISLQYREDEVISGVAGRTIRPDGSIVELKSDAVHEREMVRAGRLRVKAKSFAMPAVEPGAIVEYRWRQTQNKPRFRYARLQFQREFPVQKVTYYIVPLSHA